jgi:hypothetical protein
LDVFCDGTDLASKVDWVCMSGLEGACLEDDEKGLDSGRADEEACGKDGTRNVRRVVLDMVLLFRGGSGARTRMGRAGVCDLSSRAELEALEGAGNVSLLDVDANDWENRL